MFKKVNVFLLMCFIAYGLGYGYLADATVKEDVNTDTLVDKDKARKNEAPKIKVQDVYGKLPLSFIQNNGQVDERVRFYEKGSGHSTFFTRRGIYLALINGLHSPVIDQGLEDRNQKQEDGYSEIRNPKSEIVRLVPLGANKTPEIVAEGLQEGRVNYFTGNDPEKWKTNIPTYQSVIYKDIYKGVDMKFYGNNRQMEYDIIVKPGTSPSRVQLLYQGIEELKVTEEGNLEVSLKEGNIVQKKPYVYQEINGKRVEVAGKFKIHNSKSETQNSTLVSRHTKHFAYGFQVASYNKNYPLVIDPTLVYSTYLGGSGTDYGKSIAVDSNGNAYITGYTSSSNFPIASAIYGTYKAEDAFVTKINTSGNSLVYSTYLGGWRTDRADGIAVDASGNVYITGYTNSFDFPMKNPLSTGKMNIGGQTDAFVTKIDASGSLVYSTYLGGDEPDYGWGIAADTSGNAYVTGFTISVNFPTTASAFNRTFNGWREAFVTKIDASGSSYVYSGFLGGISYDEGYGIAVDTAGNAYVTGYTNSSNFPTVSPIYAAKSAFLDAFVTKIAASGSSIVYSTFLGGNGYDYGYGIAVDTAGNAYVTGRTASTTFPTASPIYGYLSGSWDAFVTKINDTGSSLVYSTYMGGSSSDSGYSIAVDPEGNGYITGSTGSTNFPTASAIYGSKKRNDDAFVTKIDSTGSSLVYSTFLGGNSTDTGEGIAVDATGNAYIAGTTYSTNFPTASAIYGNKKGNSDVFVTKITTDTTPPTVSSTSPASGATDVAINSTIAVTFSEAIDATTINTSTFTISGGVSGTVTYNGTNNTATFTPSGNLSNGASYTATVVAGIKDLTGNAMASDYTWSFTITSAVDTTPPTVISTSPPDGATGVAVNTPITVTFSEAMNSSSITTSTFILSSGVTGTVSYSGNTATFTPSSSLSYATTYTATITNGVMDISGNVMTSNYTWSFTTTADTVPPTIISTNPTNGATGVGIGASIIVTFSEAMDPSTFNASTFYVSRGVTGTVICNGTTATFTPSSSLSYLTYYNATITSGVKDLSGNALTTNYTWGFTTAADTTPPVVTSTNPTDGSSNVAVTTPITATFSELIDAATINTSTFIVSGGITGAVSYSGTTATFVPSTNLSNATTYTATITNGVKDIRGNPMTENYTWTFSTVSNLPQTITVVPTEMILLKSASKTVTVNVGGANSVPINNITVNATIDQTGQGLITVSPTSKVTDSNGQATFTITAMNTTVETKVNFQASGLNELAVVAVKVQ